MRKTIFRIRHSDKRKPFVAGTLASSQKAAGRDVEVFSAETGFVLLEREATINYAKKFVLRAQAAAELSLGAPLTLREFYYTLRQTPPLVEHFTGVDPKRLYSTVLAAINNLEILCDIGRERFTVGNLSKGFIYYYHSEKYSDKERKIAFTENIARSVLELGELESCANIIIIEKNAAATRLVDLGLSELTNSVILTTGGNFNRAIWAIVDRFKDEKNILFLCDGDAYGVDMLRTIMVGTEASRHLPFKFPPEENPSIHLTGLYPSIGEEVGLPNDVAAKRPLSNPYVQQRIAFLKRHGLLNDKDLEAFNRNQTFELEALSAFIKDPEGKPIGSAVYLIEYMRLYSIPLKPPLPPDDVLEEQFLEAALTELIAELEAEVEVNSPRHELYWRIYQLFTELESEILGEILADVYDDFEKTLSKVTAKEIKYHIFQQFKADPTRATYDLRAIAHKLKTKFTVLVDWDDEPLIENIEDQLDEYGGATHEHGIEFEPIHNEEEADQNPYDLVLKKLGAKIDDVVKLRRALQNRFIK